MIKAESQHLDKVAQLGCFACNCMGYFDSPAEIHHIRTGIGKGQRASNYQAIPLCPQHHRLGGHGVAIHAGQKTWEAEFGTELEILDYINKQVGHDDGSK